MKKSLRDGVDIDVAFQHFSRRQPVKPATLMDQDETGIEPGVRRFMRPMKQEMSMLFGRARRLPYILGLRTRWKKMRHERQQAWRRELQQAVETAAREARAMVLTDRAIVVEELEKKILQRLDRIESYSCAAARRTAVNCGQDEVLLRTSVGYVLCSARDHALLVCLLEVGEWEPGTRLLIEKLIKPGDCFIDVGANIGLHTLAAARAMGGQGEIIAFEPFEPTKRLLERTIWLNGFSDMVEIQEAAVSNTTGNRSLFLGETSGHHSLFERNEENHSAQASIDVANVRLDKFFARTKSIDVLKIDAEGAELEVMDSAAVFLKNNNNLTIIAEFCPRHIQSPDAWLGFFHGLGLQYKVINDQTGALETWPDSTLFSCESTNLLFSKADSDVWGKLLDS